MSQERPAIYEVLSQSLDEAEWAWLKMHAERDGLIVVSQDLDLLNVGVKLAEDNKSDIQKWIQEHKITKPTQEQLATWNEKPTKRFLSLVVQPFVLIQEVVIAPGTQTVH